MICPFCRNKIKKEDARFCAKCGKQIPRCPACNRVIDKKMRFCANDGTPLPEEMFAGFQEPQEAAPAEKVPPIEKKTRKRRVLPLLCVLLLIGLTGFLGYSVVSGNITPEMISGKLDRHTETEVDSGEETVIEDQSAADEDGEEEPDAPAGTREPDAPDTDQTSEPSAAGQAAAEAGNAVPPVSMDAVSGVSATSYLSEPKYSLVHQPSNLIDGTLDNAWIEDTPGQGEGEAITLHLDRIYQVSGFTIHAGYQKNPDIYEKNSRPAALLVSFSDGSSFDIALEDVNEQQQVIFPSAVATSSVTLTIRSVYPGSKYQDAAISEIELF